MLSGVLTPAFLQAAGRAGKAHENIITFKGNQADPVLFDTNCDGEITIESIKSGEKVVKVYSDLVDTKITIDADADTDVKIIGNVTALSIDEDGGWKALRYFDASKCKSLVTLIIGYNNSVTSILLPTLINNVSIYNNESLMELDLSNCTRLIEFDCHDCVSLEKLDLSRCTMLIVSYFNGCPALNNIHYPATDSNVSTNIAAAITNSYADDGTVYTDSDGAYYSTIATAATAKGWTIEQL